MMNPVIQRRQTRRFIQEDPIVVSLTRATVVTTPAAGTKPGTPVSLPPQAFRLIPNMAAPQRTELNRLEQGMLIKEDYILVGAWDADIAIDDEFDLNNEHYQVRSLFNRGSDGFWAGVVRT